MTQHPEGNVSKLVSESLSQSVSEGKSDLYTCHASKNAKLKLQLLTPSIHAGQFALSYISNV